MVNNASQIKSNNFSINKRTLQAILAIPGVIFYNAQFNNNQLVVFAHLSAKTAKCPSCGKRSSSVHSTYSRKLMDLFMVNRAVNIVFKVRKFRCRNVNCSQKIFSEQHKELTEKYSRMTSRATLFLQQFLVELSARKGAVISK